MKKDMKNLFLAGLLFAGVALPSKAATYLEQPFLNGWNLYATNGTPNVIGTTNNLYTSYAGQILYSLTNNVINGTLNTNSIAGDAFDPTTIIWADANGDITANAAIHYYINQTNWIPIAMTNSQGQWFVTNSWPLIQAQYPVYMYPATTNLYPSLPNASDTNLITFNFQRGWNVGTKAVPIPVWDTSTNVFQFSVVGQGFTPFSGVTNVPTSFLQGATLLRLQSISILTNTTAVASGYIINQVSFGQWVP